MMGDSVKAADLAAGVALELAGVCAKLVMVAVERNKERATVFHFISGKSIE
jgi:hypothetical protein